MVLKKQNMDFGVQESGKSGPVPRQVYENDICHNKRKQIKHRKVLSIIFLT